MANAERWYRGLNSLGAYSPNGKPDGLDVGLVTAYGCYCKFVRLKVKKLILKFI